MRFFILFVFSIIAFRSLGQNMTMIVTHKNGSLDTLKFGFNPDATLGENVSLGEKNIFMTPINGFEGRILQRDSLHFSCSMTYEDSMIYYPGNFDSKINYRDPLDTSLQNRMFEIWYSDTDQDSIEIICDIPISSFLLGGLVYLDDCNGFPPPPAGFLVIADDTIKQSKGAVMPGFGFRQYIFITNPNLEIASGDQKVGADNEMAINVYPNPTTGSIFIQHSSSQEIGEIFIYDSMGQLIDYKNPTLDLAEINLNQISNGIYTVIFVLKSGHHIIKRVIKQ